MSEYLIDFLCPGLKVFSPSLIQPVLCIASAAAIIQTATCSP